MQKVILAKSSSGDSYNVEFVFAEGALTVRCACKAGAIGQLCKHKTALIFGDETMLYDVGQKEPLAEAQDWVASTSLLKAHSELEAKLKEIEKAKKKLDEESKQVKAAFARKLIEGIR